jgi:hypothetical protein
VRGKEEGSEKESIHCNSLIQLPLIKYSSSSKKKEEEKMSKKYYRDAWRSIILAVAGGCWCG